jgi:perosamine synthetase
MQAAVGLAQLEQLDHLLNLRTQIQNRYDARLADSTMFTAPSKQPGRNSVTWLVSYLLDPNIDRDGFIRRAGECGIDVRPFFYPLSDMPPYRRLPGGFTAVAHEISSRGVSLPTSPCLDMEAYDQIIDALHHLSTHRVPAGRNLPALEQIS